MTIDENHPLLRQMLAELYRHTGGDPSASASMYDLGAAAGIDRQEAQEVGQALIGAGLAAIVSLSGKIGITVEGIASIQGPDADRQTDAGVVGLGQAPVIEATAKAAVEAIVARIKTQTADEHWDFDQLAELMADIRTLEAQLASPRPKTPIVRQCLHALRSVLDNNGARGQLARIDALIGA